ncbi:MAG: hypothetical protein AAFY71_05905 [Bacteroidota bacterium]
MDWKEIQEEWNREEQGNKETFSIPDPAKIESISKEIWLFNLDHSWDKYYWGAILGSVITLALLIAGFMYQEPKIFFACALLAIATICCLVLVTQTKKVGPEMDMKVYLGETLKHAKIAKRIAWVLMVLVALVNPFYTFFKDGFDPSHPTDWAVAGGIIVFAGLALTAFHYFQKSHSSYYHKLPKAIEEILEEMG